MGLQLYFLSRRVPTIGASQYVKDAIHLHTAGESHYGYVQGHHGAYLVRSTSSISLLGHASIPDEEIHRLMASQLDSIPTRAVLEMAFYIAVISWLFVVLPVVARRFGRRHSTTLKRSLAAGFASVVTYLLIILPFLTLGYGDSAFTNWAGPGAFSYTNFGAGRLTFQSGLTISYRPLLEFILSIPVWTLKPFSWPMPHSNTLEMLMLGLDFPSGLIEFFVEQVLTYFGLGALGAQLLLRFRRRRFEISNAAGDLTTR